jgi:methenyltetrahydromethanopterin cyclohydrolase
MHIFQMTIMSTIPSANTLALSIVLDLKTNAKLLGLSAEKLDNEALLIDASAGNDVAGAKVGEICMGGLGTVQLTMMQVGSHYLPATSVYTGYPAVACMAAQYAGWQVKVKNEETGHSWKAMCSGPARAKARVEKELFERIGYEDPALTAVAVFETGTAPTPEVMEYVAEKCGVEVKDTSAVWASTKSAVGSVQVAARVVETSIHKIFEVSKDAGFQIEDRLLAGHGIAPIAPLAKDDLEAMGRTNDGIIAAGAVTLSVAIPEEEEDAFWEVMAKVPAGTAAGYGEPFFETFKAAGFDFYKIDPGLFAPASVAINNTVTGRCRKFGDVDPILLEKSFFS